MPPPALVSVKIETHQSEHSLFFSCVFLSLGLLIFLSLLFVCFRLSVLFGVFVGCLFVCSFPSCLMLFGLSTYFSASLFIVVFFFCVLILAFSISTSPFPVSIFLLLSPLFFIVSRFLFVLKISLGLLVLLTVLRSCCVV